MSEDPDVNVPGRPIWGTSRPSLLAIWVEAGESPEWIAMRTDALLSELGSAFGVSEWRLSNGVQWEGSPHDLANIVRSCPVRELVSEDVDGDPVSGEGYTFTVSGLGPRVAPLVRISAGNVAVGRRLPRRRLSVEVRETVAGSATSEDGDAVCAAVARAWRPATTEFADLAVRQLARRGGWQIGVGYRTWISSDVGEVSHVADGLTKAEVAGGTLVSAPDDWSANRVVESMLATLSANNLDEVPH